MFVSVSKLLGAGHRTLPGTRGFRMLLQGSHEAWTDNVYPTSFHLRGSAGKIPGLWSVIFYTAKRVQNLHSVEINFEQEGCKPA